MKFLAIIPARKGSKGIKNKNFKLFNGKPLIYWTIKAAKKSKYLDKIIVSTDSKKIQKFCLTKNILAPFIRPKKISHAKAKGHDVIIHTINFLRKNLKYIPDAIVYLQPTSPLRETIDINNCCKLYKKYKPDSLVSIVKLHHNLNPEEIYKKKGIYKLIKLNKKKSVPFRQAKKNYYGKNGAAIFISNVKKINKFVDGGNLIGYEMNKLKSIDIDELDDFKLAEVIQKRFKFNY